MKLLFVFLTSIYCTVCLGQQILPEEYEGYWSGELYWEGGNISVFMNIESCEAGEWAGRVKYNSVSCTGNLYFVKTYTDSEGVEAAVFNEQITGGKQQSQCTEFGKVTIFYSQPRGSYVMIWQSRDDPSIKSIGDIHKGFINLD